MKNIVLAGIVGGVILWVWGFLAWVVLPLHTPTMSSLPHETEMMEILRRNLPAKGVYEFPAMPAEASSMPIGEQEAAMKAYMEKFESGPTGLLFYDPAGKDPFMASQLVGGLIIFMISAGIVGWLLARSTAAAESFLSRVIYCGMIGVLIAVVVHLSQWNWMGNPLDWTRAQMIDSIVGWLLAGAGIAAVVKEKRAPAAA